MVLLKTFDNYISAHVALTKLQSEGFHPSLRDENLVTVEPFLLYATGGIKLVVPEDEAEEAMKALPVDAP
jgi:hypothetical protein